VKDVRTKLVTVAAICGAAIGGGAIANAATSNSTGSTTQSGAPGQQARPTFAAHGTAAHEALEKAVTGANASKVQAAAIKAVGSGNAGAVTTDVSGNGYEVTVTKADGSQVEVHLDGSFSLDDHGRLGGWARCRRGRHQPAPAGTAHRSHGAHTRRTRLQLRCRVPSD